MTFDKFFNNVIDIIVNPLIWLIFGIAIVVFLWGAMEFFVSAEDAEKRTTGKQHMFWGIIGMAIMMSAYGIVNLITSTIESLNSGA
ncbi:MAG: hypothetical protein WCW14_01520 [Candidatus Paceibacterota bacterium]|jgi:hypothetical protein